MVQRRSQSAVPDLVDPEARLLVTGGSGFLGAAVLRSSRRPVIAVARPSRRAGRRLPKLLGQGRSPIEVVEGDVLDPALGVDVAAVRRTGPVAAVLHLAAVTDWSTTWPETKRTNVDGARRALEAATALGCPLIHVSSSYAAFRPAGEVPSRLVDDHPTLSKYERSKWLAEHLVADRATIEGTPVTIVRIAALVGDAARPDATVAPLARLIELLDPPFLPFARGARVDLTPRDEAADRLLAIADRPSPPGPTVVVEQIGQGRDALSLGAVFTESADVQARTGRRPRRPLRCPASTLMRASQLGDRAHPGPRATALIGLKYFASRAVYPATIPAGDLPLATMVRLLGHHSPSPPPLASFYAGWGAS